MNAVVILLVGIVILVLGYIFYGGWLAKQWGVDPKEPHLHMNWKTEMTMYRQRPRC